MTRKMKQKAFDMFTKGFKVHQVAQELRITCEQAKELRIVFLKDETLSIEERQEVTDSYIRKLDEDRKNFVKGFFKKMKAMSYAEQQDKLEINNRLRLVKNYCPEAEQILLFPDDKKPISWRNKPS